MEKGRLTPIELKKILRDNGYSTISNHLHNDDTIISLTIWTIDDIPLDSKEDINIVVYNLDIDILEDCSTGNEHIEKIIEELRDNGDIL